MTGIPGGFDSWDDYDNWLDSVLESGRHPELASGGNSFATPSPTSDARVPHIQSYPGIDDDFRYLTHPHNGWEQTGPGSLRKTDWSGTQHTINVDDDGVVSLHSAYPDGTAQAGDFDSLRQADDRANKRSINNILMPMVAQHEEGFQPSQDGSDSVTRRDEDGWRHRITPFRDHRGQTWYTYEGGNGATGEHTARDHPSLEAALEHSRTRQDPMAGQVYRTAGRALGAVSRASDTVWR